MIVDEKTLKIIKKISLGKTPHEISFAVEDN
jgi:hypothetical protein